MQQQRFLKSGIGDEPIAELPRHGSVAAPDSSALTTFARRLPATLPAPAVARARIRKGRPVRLQLTCPAGPAWCVGRVVASSLRVGRRRIRLGQPTFAIRPGATLTVRLAQRSPRAGGRRVRLVARLRVQEPWGAVALSAVSLPTGR